MNGADRPPEARGRTEWWWIAPLAATIALIPVALGDLISWAVAKYAWGCAWAVDVDEGCDWANDVDMARFGVVPWLWSLTVVVVLRLWWACRLPDPSRRRAERRVLLIAALVVQVAGHLWLWWGAPDLDDI